MMKLHAIRTLKEKKRGLERSVVGKFHVGDYCPPSTHTESLRTEAALRVE